MYVFLSLFYVLQINNEDDKNLGLIIYVDKVLDKNTLLSIWNKTISMAACFLHLKKICSVMVVDTAVNYQFETWNWFCVKMSLSGCLKTYKYFLVLIVKQLYAVSINWNLGRLT